MEVTKKEVHGESKAVKRPVSQRIRKIIYTTKAIRSLPMQLRKVLKTRGHFPSVEAGTKLICLVRRDITKKWMKPPTSWKMAATQFAIRFGQRFLAVEI